MKEIFVHSCFNASIHVDIIYNKKNDNSFFASPIWSIPNNNLGKFYEQLLISNPNVIENRGAVLGFEEEENCVVLSYTFFTSTFTLELFKTIWQLLLNLLKKILSNLKDFKFLYHSLL